MHQVGDIEAGFEVAFDVATRTVRVEAWGFWGIGLAPSFRDTVLDACGGGNSATRLHMEMMRLKPLREEGEEAWLDILTKVRNQGIEAIVVKTNSLTKLQLLRIARQSASKNIVQFQ